MNLKEAMDVLPDTDKKVLVVLSGGLDSSIMTILLSSKYGHDNVVALSYDYGQKQRRELEMAAELCGKLEISHKILDLKILGEIAEPICANIKGSAVEMPTIQDVLGDPQPKTYVPFRNMIMLSLTMAAAEASGASHVFTGLQVHDEYGYWDTSQTFVDGMNAIAAMNRTHKVEIQAPFSLLSKTQELEILKELSGDEPHVLDHWLKSTLTCYDPNEKGESCGVCPSCAERVNAFMKIRHVDPVPYSIVIPWKK